MARFWDSIIDMRTSLFPSILLIGVGLNVGLVGGHTAHASGVAIDSIGSATHPAASDADSIGGMRDTVTVLPPVNVGGERITPQGRETATQVHVDR